LALTRGGGEDVKASRIALLSLIGISLSTGVGCTGAGTITFPTATAYPQADVKVISHELDCGASADIRVMNDDLDCVTSAWSDYCNCDLTGAVKNFGGDASGVTVHADFTDDLDVKVAEGSSYVGQLKAGQSAQFNVPYYELECPDGFEITVAEWTDDCDCHLTGVVGNAGGVDASGVSVGVRFFDGQGAVLAEEWEYIGNIPSAQTVNYNISYWGGQCPEDYSVWAEWQGDWGMP
jgi:hypothetical protein